MDNMPAVFLEHPQWPAAQYILKTLHQNGHVAYLAGGCVRDALLGVSPKDIDIATDAKADVVQKYFPDNVDVGKDFGVIIVKFEGLGLEVTTFRKDGPYKDGRHPSSVTFSSAKEDALRRDFTVNALFYDVQTNRVIDMVGGIADLLRKTIKAVGEPGQRFEEDRLRVLRAIRFAAQLDFQLDPTLLQKIKDYSSQLGSLSKERVTAELTKIFTSNHILGLQLLRETGCLQKVWPELTFVNSGAEFGSFLKNENETVASDLFLPALIARLLRTEEKFRKGTVVDSLKRFTWPKSIVEAVHFCLENLPRILEGNTRALLLLDHRYGLHLWEFATSVTKSESEFKKLNSLRSTYLRLAETEGKLPKNLIAGDDLKNLGVPQGPLYKKILEEAYLLQLEGKLRTKDEALKWAASFW